MFFQWLDTKLKITNCHYDTIKRSDLHKFTITEYFNHIYSKQVLKKLCIQQKNKTIIMILCDSIRSSLTQLVTRYTRHGRFIRRHLLTPVWPGANYIMPNGVGPSILHGELRRGTTSPTPLLTLGPTGSTRAENASHVPLAPPRLSP
jgi:hypothetical protein